MMTGKNLGKNVGLLPPGKQERPKYEGPVHVHRFPASARYQSRIVSNALSKIILRFEGNQGDIAEVEVKGKTKIVEEVEEERSAKMTGENLGKKIDPVSVLKMKKKEDCLLQSPDVLQKQAVEAVDEVIEISSDDDETGDVVIGNEEMVVGKEQVTKKRVTKEQAAKEQTTKEQVKSLEAQISGMSLELECPVCFNVCSPPIYMCLAQHPVCSGCRSNLKECAVCREPYTQGMIRHRFVKTSRV